MSVRYASPAASVDAITTVPDATTAPASSASVGAALTRIRFSFYVTSPLETSDERKT
jgi:hypothetical protein